MALGAVVGNTGADRLGLATDNGLTGTGNEACDSCHPHHSPKFKIDESELIRGTALYCQVAVDFNSR